jgi:hypothetical protein
MARGTGTRHPQELLNRGRPFANGIGPKPKFTPETDGRKKCNTKGLHWKQDLSPMETFETCQYRLQGLGYVDKMDVQNDIKFLANRNG